SIQKNTKKEIEEIYLTYCFKFSKGLSIYSYANNYETWKKHVNHLIDTVKVVQRAWRAFKLRSETWAKRVWNRVRNDGTPAEGKFLGIDLSIKKTPNNYYIANNVDKKKEQLR